MSRSKVYSLIADEDFPPKIQLGPRAIGFLENEIDEWVLARADARSTPILNSSELIDKFIKRIEKVINFNKLSIIQKNQLTKLLEKLITETNSICNLPGQKQ